MTDYMLPSDLVPYAQSFYLQPHTGGSESPFSRQTKAYGLSAPRFVTRMSFRAPDSSDRWAGPFAEWGEQMDAFLAKVAGRQNRVVVWDFRRDEEDAALVNAAVSAGTDTIAFSGGTPKVGKYVGGDGRPHIITSVSGSIATVKPPFRSDIAAGDAIYGIGYGFFRLTSDDAGGNMTEVGTLTGYDLEFVEDLAPGPAIFFPSADYFDDSVTGDDSDPGTTIPTAKRTLGGIPWTDDIRVGLVGDSHWRESLDENYSGMEIRGVKAGDLPLIDGSDPVTGWTAHATQTDWWEKAGWTHEGTGTDRLTIYENGVLLSRVAAVGSVSVPSFKDVKGSDGSTVTLQAFFGAGVNPNTNGKLQEASRRAVAFQALAGGTFSGFQTRRGVSGSGSFRAGPNSTLSRILAVDGTKHNLFMASGTASDCIAFASDTPTSYELSSTFFVSYMDDTAGSSFTYERCGAVQPAVIGLNAGAGNLAFYSHSAGAPVYDSGTLRQCWAVGPIYGGHPGFGADSQLEEGCHWDCLQFLFAGTQAVRYSTANIAVNYRGINSTPNSFTKQTLQHCAFSFKTRHGATSNFNEAFRPAGGASHATVLTYCAIFNGGSTAYNDVCFANSSATGGTQATDHSIIYGFFGGLLQVATGVTYTGDFNVFSLQSSDAPSQKFEGTWHGATYSTLAAWQTATGQDAHSVCLDPADQVAGNPHAFWLAYAGASGGSSLASIGPAVGDFRINPNARVYSGAGTAYIGTFPDGSAITSAGPQSHWDWNARAVAAGPPRKFANVPRTLADSEDYCSAPDGWRF